MTSRRRFWTLALALVFVMGGLGVALSQGNYPSMFTQAYPAATYPNAAGIAGCSLCHPAGGGNNAGNLNAYANAWSNAGGTVAAFHTIEGQDSDGDGATNLAEITAGTFPGNAASKPAGGGADTTAPAVTVFTVPAQSPSLTISITTLTATDAVGVTGYLITETATAPLASDAGWSGTKPTNYTASSAGAKTLRAWAKDAAGNVSTARTANTTITLPDQTAPNVTAFQVTATPENLTVDVTAFTATDAGGVTGYKITESSTIPGAGATGWTANAPTTYTFSAAGTFTLYGWAKDAAGNVSGPLSVQVTVTPPEAIPPTITSFVVPATSESLVVPVEIVAEDNVGVTGYKLTETNSKPLASATGWSGTAPANYTFSSTGTKALYAWAKDAAGNVSDATVLSTAQVVLTVPDTKRPTVSKFVMPAKSTTLTVDVDLTATDDIGVAGYLLTETATVPDPGAVGWTETAPTSYDFDSSGTWTLYAWAKDGAGNVSSSKHRRVVVGTADKERPIVDAFVVADTASSLTIAVDTFTATDNVGVTGYMLTGKPGRPRATAEGWTSTPPASFTFVRTGRRATFAKNVYAWAKDAEGNVSRAVKQRVVITLSEGDEGEGDDD